MLSAEPEVVEGRSCPKCDSPLWIREGRYGKFIGCSNYPDCKYIKLKEIGVACPKEGCKGGQVVERRSRRGRTWKH